MRAGTLATMAVLLAAAGCGSAPGFPPAAEPATSPPIEAAPAGRVVALDGTPEGIVADGETGLVAAGVRNPDALALVRGRSGREVRRVPLPESPRHLQLAAPGGPLLVPAERADELVTVDLPRGQLDAIPVGAFPHDATRVADRTFVGDEQSDTISVIEGGSVIETISAPVQPGGLAATGDRVAVVAVAERVVELFDARTLASLGRVGAGVGPTHVVADTAGRLYVSDTEGDAILVYRTRPELELIDRVNAPGSPYGLAIDARRSRLWVTLTERNRLDGYALGEGPPRRVATHATVRQPNTVAVDERRGAVFVAGAVDDELQTIDDPFRLP